MVYYIQMAHNHVEDSTSLWLCYALALLLCANVMTARIYYLCHYVLDTLVGAFLGLVLAVFTLRIDMHF